MNGLPNWILILRYHLESIGLPKILRTFDSDFGRNAIQNYVILKLPRTL